MKPTRREFLKSCAATTAGLVVAETCAVAAPAKTDKPAKQPECPTISGGKELSLCWRGYRWIAKGNVVQWQKFKPSADGKRSVLDEYGLQVLPTRNICVGFAPDKDNLFWRGDHDELWRVRPSYRYDDFPFEFSFISYFGNTNAIRGSELCAFLS